MDTSRIKSKMKARDIPAEANANPLEDLHDERRASHAENLANSAKDVEVAVGPILGSKEGNAVVSRAVRDDWNIPASMKENLPAVIANFMMRRYPDNEAHPETGIHGDFICNAKDIANLAQVILKMDELNRSGDPKRHVHAVLDHRSRLDAIAERLRVGGPSS